LRKQVRLCKSDPPPTGAVSDGGRQDGEDAVRKDGGRLAGKPGRSQTGVAPRAASCELAQCRWVTDSRPRSDARQQRAEANATGDGPFRLAGGTASGSMVRAPARRRTGGVSYWASQKGAQRQDRHVAVGFRRSSCEGASDLNQMSTGRKPPLRPKNANTCPAIHVRGQILHPFSP